MLQAYAAPGSDLYYVLRTVAGDRKAAYLALSAFCIDLNRTAEEYKEVSVAEQKFAWWFKEVERLFAGEANHPFMLELAPFTEHLSKTAMLALIEANLLSLKTQIFETRSELLQHYQHLGGIRFALLASLINARSVATEIHLHQLGVASEILRHLRDFGNFLARQHLYFAMADFQKLGIDPHPILQLKNLETLMPLFQEYFELARAECTILSTMPKPFKAEMKLKLKQMERISKENWQFYRHHVELSPLLKLFTVTFG